MISADPEVPAEPQRTVFMGYISAHGTTRAIALHICQELIKAGFTVKSRDLARIPFAYANVKALLEEIKSCNLVLLGSAMKHSDWQPQLRPLFGFIEHELLDLTVPVHYFTVCDIGTLSSFYSGCCTNLLRRRQLLPPMISSLASKVDSHEAARTHHFFAGRADVSQFGCGDTIFLRCMGGTLGDHVSWAEVNEWIANISRQ